MRRKALRLRDFDYAIAGLYFVTVCTYQRRCVLGRIEADEMILSAFGQIVSAQIAGLPRRLVGVSVDTFVVMPNHVHVLVELHPRPVGATLASPDRTRASRARQASPLHTAIGAVGATLGSPGLTQASRVRQASPLQTVVGGFKSGSTREINALGSTLSPVWQRGYHDRIVRNEDELGRIREYIATNPVRWALDPENPNNVRP